MPRVSLPFLLFAALVSACAGEAALDQTPAPQVIATGLRVDAVVPSRVSVEGGEVAQLFGARFCPAPRLFLDGEQISVGRVASTELTFVVPAARSLDAVTSVAVTVACEDEEATVADALTYDPALVVQPQIVSYGPVGDDARRDTSVWVQFNRAMDPASLQGSIGLEGRAGRVVWDDRTFVAAFVPDEPLERGQRVIAYLRGEEEGVRSSFGDALTRGIIWRFRVCETCTVALP